MTFRLEERDGIVVRVFRDSLGHEFADESSFRPLPADHRQVVYQPNRMCEPCSKLGRGEGGATLGLTAPKLVEKARLTAGFQLLHADGSGS